MIDKSKIQEILDEYDSKELTIATVCSHSSLQIFHGARQEGFKTLGICLGRPPKFYDAFPLAKPDTFLSLDSYGALLDESDRLVEENAIVVPHGSLVEYLGTDRFEEMPVPTFGNRRSLAWRATGNGEGVAPQEGIDLPRRFANPEEIVAQSSSSITAPRAVRASFISKSRDYMSKFDPAQRHNHPGFILGTPVLHPLLLPPQIPRLHPQPGDPGDAGIDRRVESNADEIFRIGSMDELEAAGIFPSFVVTGNIPLVLRESLLPKAFDLGERVVEASLDLFGGMIGPFCLETIVTDDLKFKVFEISARIVAGTNVFISGSPYSDLIERNLSNGRRIAQEISLARDQGRLSEIIS
jgi:5-formaminoimidazole-4-carboxamide-1-(beta)-D-ribofuranosyl 5'-monophosphate synthetase